MRGLCFIHRHAPPKIAQKCADARSLRLYGAWAWQKMRGAVGERERIEVAHLHGRLSEDACDRHPLSFTALNALQDASEFEPPEGFED